MPTTILTIEDDAAIRRGIVDSLTYAGYRVLEAGDGQRGMDLALSAEFDLLLLDLVLPVHSGMEILEKVREAKPTTPIIILTARGEEQDRVGGLRKGADDYVVKPFSVKELMARVEAVLRRSPQRPSDVNRVELPTCTADFERCELRYPNGERTELSERELSLLRYLIRNQGRAIAREELLQNVWHIDPRGVATRTIDMHVARLREKLRDSSTEPQIVVTVRGRGYMFAQCTELPSDEVSAGPVKK